MKQFKSLLHYIDKDQVAALTAEDVDTYYQEWIQSAKHPIHQAFTEPDALIEAVSLLKENLTSQKALFNLPAILSFIENGKVESTFAGELKSASHLMEDPWLRALLEHNFIEKITTKVHEPGFQAVQFVKGLSDSLSGLPMDMQDRIESRSRRLIKERFRDYENTADDGNLTDCKDIVSKHYLQSLKALPFESDDLLQSYGKISELIARKYLPSYTEDRISEEEQITFAKAAEIAGSILGDEELKKIASDHKLKQENKGRSPSKNIAKFLSILIAVVIIVWGGMKLYRIIDNETSTYDERYADYVKKNNEFLKNRQISQEIIEQRKVTEIIDSYQYGEREEVPLFYTFIKTNKFLDINDIENELYRLKSAINTEGIDTEKIFALVHFFTTDIDRPYRKVMAEYSNLQSTVKYNQVVKPRGSNSFKVYDWEDQPRKVSVEVEESYPSGVMELVIYDFIFTPDEEKVEIFSYTPMPELSESLGISAFRQMQLHGGELDNVEVGAMLRLIEELLKDHQYKYRIPYYPGEVSYDVNSESIAPMYNWELTTSDDLAFVRVRSEKVKGYYLINTESGRPVQAKISYKKKDKVRRSYLIQWVSTD